MEVQYTLAFVNFVIDGKECVKFDTAGTCLSWESIENQTWLKIVFTSALSKELALDRCQDILSLLTLFCGKPSEIKQIILQQNSGKNDYISEKWLSIYPRKDIPALIVQDNILPKVLPTWIEFATEAHLPIMMLFNTISQEAIIYEQLILETYLKVFDGIYTNYYNNITFYIDKKDHKTIKDNIYKKIDEIIDHEYNFQCSVPQKELYKKALKLSIKYANKYTLNDRFQHFFYEKEQLFKYDFDLNGIKQDDSIKYF